MVCFILLPEIASVTNAIRDVLAFDYNSFFFLQEMYYKLIYIYFSSCVISTSTHINILYIYLFAVVCVCGVHATHVVDVDFMVILFLYDRN